MRRSIFSRSFALLAAAAPVAHASPVSFGPAVTASFAPVPTVYENMALAPAGEGQWAMVACARTDSGGSDSYIVVTRSNDDGASWSAPATLNSNEAGDGMAADCGSAVTSGDSGRLIALWSSHDSLGGTIGSDGDIFVSRSDDGGGSWTAAVPLHASAGSDTEDDGDVAVASAGAMIIAAWRATDAGAHQIRVSRSYDNGVTWHAPVTVFEDEFATSTGRPAIASNGGSTWFVAWASDASEAFPPRPAEQIFYIRSTNDGAIWSPPEILNDDPTDAFADTDVSLTAAGTLFVAVWSSDDTLGGSAGTDRDILFSHTPSQGMSFIGWTAAEPLNAYAYQDVGDDVSPSVRGAADGSFVAVWATDENFGATIARDLDVMMATSNGGAVWTWPAALNTTAVVDEDRLVDLDADHSPVVAADGDGTWLSGWLFQADLAQPYAVPRAARAIRDCPAEPSESCRTPTAAARSKLSISSGLLGRDTIKWVWKNGEETLLYDFGDPSDDTAYALCIYAGDGVDGWELAHEEDVPFAGSCGGAPCWKATGSGWRFSDVTSSRGGVRKLGLKAGGEGAASIKLVAAGPMVDPPLMPLEPVPNVRMQLLRPQTGRCWEASFSAASVNTGNRYQAVAD